jgi:putative inorganic carbon (HCO3(-)) transporter
MLAGKDKCMRSVLQSWWAQVFQNRLVALVLAMAVFIPLVATPADSSLHGVAALAFEGFAIVLLTILLWRVRWDLRRERVLSFLRTGPNLPVLLFFCLAVISCLLSPLKVFSAQETLRIGAGILLYFVVAYHFRRSEHLYRLVDTLLFVTIVASLVGFAQYSLGASERASGVFGNDQLLGSFLMVLLPIAAVTAIVERSINRQLAAQAATVLAAGCLLLAHSRSAWLGAAAGLAVLGALALIVALKQGKLARKKHLFVLPAMLTLVSVGFFLWAWPQSGSIVERAGTFTRLTQDTSWNQRVHAWEAALTMARAKPLTGIGIGVYPAFSRPVAHTGAWLTTNAPRASLGEQAHNLYVQTVVELGIPGLLLFVSIIAVFLLAAIRRVRQMDSGIRRDLLLAAIASMVAFSVDAFGSPSWQFGQLSLFFWLLLGVGVGCMRPHSRKQEDLSPEVVPRRVTRPAAVATSLALASLLPTVVTAANGASYSESNDNTAAIAGGVAGAGVIAYLVLSHGHPFGRAQGGAAAAVTPPLTLEPANATITAGNVQTFSVYENVNGVRVDVSLFRHTTFTQTGGRGYMAGPNNRDYVSVPGENDTPTITATFNPWVDDKPDEYAENAPGEAPGAGRAYVASATLTVH